MSKTILLVLVALALASCVRPCERDPEKTLKSNLVVLRQVIIEYKNDKGRAPRSLQDLVREGYIRQIPIDPITGSNQSWRVVEEGGGIVGIRSGSDQKSSDGRPYSGW